MATVEYAALVVLLSIVLAVAGAAVTDSGIEDAIVRQVKRALCIVTGGDCGDEPCVVSSRETGTRHEAGAFLVSADDEHRVLREKLSNGHVRVTVVQSTGGAVGKELDVKAKVLGKEIDATVGLEGGGDVGYGRVYELESDAAADRFLGRRPDDWAVGGAFGGAVDMLRGDGKGSAEQYLETRTRAQAEAALDVLGFEPGLAGLGGGAGGGIRRSHRTGELTVFFSREASASLDLSLGLASAGLALEGDRTVALTFDRDRRPVALTISGAHGGGAHATAGAAAAKGARRTEIEAKLDLTDPARRLLAARLALGDGVALGALARFSDQADVTTRLYATDRDERESGLSFLDIGYKRIQSTATARLLEARHKPAGGAWARTCQAA